MPTVYEIVTERIIEGIQATNILPWQKKWSGPSDMPKNLVSGKEYRGVNIFLLGAQGFASPYFLTYKQAVAKGGQVRKGEKSTPVIFWKVTDREKDGKQEKGFILRYYNVFNVSQCDGLEGKVPEAPASREFSPIEECERLVKLYRDIPGIDHGGDRACYSPTFDRINMPPRSSFQGEAEYYSTFFHELVHSTGHESRLNREGITNPIRFASHDYSFEELVAECGAAFLCAKAGIENRTIDNSIAYINHWIGKLKREPKWIVEACGKATKAADYIQGIKPGAKSEDEDEEAAA